MGVETKILPTKDALNWILFSDAVRWDREIGGGMSLEETAALVSQIWSWQPYPTQCPL
jgi:hypothetical protein